MTGPVQRPASNSEGRKRNLPQPTVVGMVDSYTGRPATIYTPPENLAPAPGGVHGYMVALDAYDVPTVWRLEGTFPMAAISRDSFRDDPALWDALVAAVRGDR